MVYVKGNQQNTAVHYIPMHLILKMSQQHDLRKQKQNATLCRDHSRMHYKRRYFETTHALQTDPPKDIHSK